jgi:hypothetical protein
VGRGRSGRPQERHNSSAQARPEHTKAMVTYVPCDSFFRLPVLVLACSLPACSNGDAPTQTTDKSTAPRVQTSFGLLEGEQLADTRVFRGVPYAQPPVGDGRPSHHTGRRGTMVC